LLSGNGEERSIRPTIKLFALYVVFALYLLLKIIKFICIRL